MSLFETAREVGVIYTNLKNKVDNLGDPFLIGIIIIQRKAKSNKKKTIIIIYKRNQLLFYKIGKNLKRQKS